MFKKILVSLLPLCLASGFGSTGIQRQSICGAIIVSGGNGWQNAVRGVPANEEGFNISKHEVRYYLAVNDKMPGNTGEPVARAQSDKFSRDITQEGELVGAIPFAIATACELANEIAHIGDGSGDVFFDEATVSDTRGGWETISMKMSSDPLVVIGA